MLGTASLLRSAAVLVMLALAAAACVGSGPASGDLSAPSDEPDGPPGATGGSESGDPPPWPWDATAAGDHVRSAVPLDEIRPGGPPPDGIPPIDRPAFESVQDARRWLEPQDPVLIVEVDGDARAYPLAILTYHEIVNDVVAGRPLLVTYCPLCNSGLVFDRSVDGEVLDFGTSGRLWHSNLVMYDRATRSLWAQFTGEAIVGKRLGTRLQRLPAQVVALSTFATRWPQGRVLSRDTGHLRPYGSNPYVGYDSASAPLLFDGATAGPLPQMARVVTVGGETDPVAYPLETLRRQRAVADTVDGEPVVVLWTPGTASALDSASISDGGDVGATGVFRPVVGDRRLTFEPHGADRFRDTRTGSTWTVLGTAIDGPLAGSQLQRLAHDDTFWFVQYAFRPDTRVADRR